MDHREQDEDEPRKNKDMWICFSNAIPEPAPPVMDSVNIQEKLAHIGYLECDIMTILNGTVT